MLYSVVQHFIVECDGGREDELLRAVRGTLRKAQVEALGAAGFQLKAVESEVRHTLRDEALSLPRKKHLFSESTHTNTACETRAARKNIVREREKVDCKLCLRMMGSVGEGSEL